MTLIVYCKIKSLENVTHLIQLFFPFFKFLVNMISKSELENMTLMVNYHHICRKIYVFFLKIEIISLVTILSIAAGCTVPVSFQ